MGDIIRKIKLFETFSRSMGNNLSKYAKEFKLVDTFYFSFA